MNYSPHEYQAEAPRKRGAPKWLKITGIVFGAFIVLSVLVGIFGDDDAEAGGPTSADDQDAAAQEDEEDEPESDDEDVEPEEEEESRFSVDHDEGDFEGGATFVRFDIADNFSQGLIASTAQRDTCEALEVGMEEYPDAGRIAVEGSFPTMDEYGNEDDSVILRAHYESDTLDRIDWDNCQIIDVWDLRDGGQIHPDLLENR